MLRNLPEKHNSRWRDHLNKVVHAYSCTKNDSTGYAPFFLLFARPLPLPIDLMFYHKPPTGFSSHPEYVRKSKCYVRSLQDSEPAQLNTQRGNSITRRCDTSYLSKICFFQKSWITTSYAWRQSACSKPEWAGQTRKSEVIMGKPGTRSYGTEGEWYASLRGPTRIGDQAIQSTAPAKIL